MTTSSAIEPSTGGMPSPLPQPHSRGQLQIVDQARQRYLAQHARAGLAAQASDDTHAIYAKQRDLITADAYDVQTILDQFPVTFLKPLLQAILVHQLQTTGRYDEALLATFVKTAQETIANPFLVDQRNGIERLIGRKPTYASF
jgi:hypothetical protein